MKNRIPIAAAVVTTLVQLVTLAGLVLVWQQQHVLASRWDAAEDHDLATARAALKAAIRLYTEDSPPRPHLTLVKPS